MPQLHLGSVFAQASIPLPAAPQGKANAAAETAESRAWQAAERFRLLDETPAFLLVDKPPGLLIHPTKPGGPRTLWHGLMDLLAYEVVTGNPPGILTRLDRETSGLVLVGKGRAAIAHLSDLLATGQMTKTYQALVFGWPLEEAWTVEAPLRRIGEVEPVKVWLRRGVHPAGAPARTDFRVLRRLTTRCGRPIAHVAACPQTGRTHQIRVHLAHSGYPLVGDKLYAAGEECYLRFIAEGWSADLEKILLHSRQALHAQALSFETPEGRRTWQSPWPEDLQEWEARWT